LVSWFVTTPCPGISDPSDKPSFRSETIMTTETLHSLTHETIHLYAHTAKTLVRTYRTGANRALGDLRKRLGHPSAAAKAERPVRSSFVNVGQELAAVVGRQIDALSTAANGAIDAVARGSDSTLGAFAGAADRFYRTLPSQASQLFAQINLPAVRLSRDLATQISRGAERVAKRVGAQERPRAAAKATAKAARKPARTAKRTRKA